MAGSAYVSVLVALTLALLRASACGAVASVRMWDRALSAPPRVGTSGTLADVNGDGLPDLLVSRSSRKDGSLLAAVEGATGRELWRSRLAGRIVWEAVEPSGGPVLDVAVATGMVVSVLDARTGSRLRSVTLAAPVGGLAVGTFGPGGAVIVCSAGASANDRLVALRGSDLKELWAQTCVLEDWRFGRGFSDLALADLDGDGADEILATENMSTLTCRSADGSLLWSTVLGEMTALIPTGGASCGPVIHDLIPGGAREVAIGCFGGWLLVLDGASGEVVTKAQFGTESHRSFLERIGVPRFLREIVRTSGEPIMDILAADVDGVPGSELVFGCSDGFVYAANPRTGARLWAFKTSKDVSGRPVAVNADAEGAHDVIVWHEAGMQLIDGRSGAPIPGLPQGADLAHVFAGDMNGDGRLDVVTAAFDEAGMTAWSTDIPCEGGSRPGESK